MELIDDVIKHDRNQSLVKVKLGKVEYSSWVIAKPINPRWIKSRIRDAWKVLIGKAIAVRYFEDFNNEEKLEYVKKHVYEKKT
jgi:hypothetical protein